MASGSAKSLQVCKEPEDFTASVSCPAASRKMVTPANLDYSVPSGYKGILAGFSCETDLTSTPTTPITALMTSEETNIVAIRNYSSTNYTRHIKLYATFIKSSFTDDRR